MLRESKPVQAVRRSARFRHVTNRLRFFPSFLIIGTQPAGTRSLFNALRQHPDIVGQRELYFFDQRFSNGVDWYRSFFPLSTSRLAYRLRGGDLVAGESAPTYLFHPDVPERVAQVLPDVAVIALLRDPIERAYWHYESLRLKGLEPLSFAEALAAEGQRAVEEEGRVVDPHDWKPHEQYGYAARGLYADQLERWFAFFPRDRFFVRGAEDYAAEPAAIYEEVLAFLEVRARRPRRFPEVDWMTPAPIDPALRRQLEERFAEPNAKLTRLLDREFRWSGAATPSTPATDETAAR
jgi:lipopolysaccharide transport system ATP-binding protein